MYDYQKLIFSIYDKLYPYATRNNMSIVSQNTDLFHDSLGIVLRMPDNSYIAQTRRKVSKIKTVYYAGVHFTVREIIKLQYNKNRQ